MSIIILQRQIIVCLSVNCANSTISTDVDIQLETISFTVDEEVGSVEVCINVTTDQECPIEFDAGVTLSSRRGTAGAVINNYTQK